MKGRGGFFVLHPSSFRLHPFGKQPVLTRYRPTRDQPWNLQRVVHLHRRAGYGACWSEIQRDLKDGPDVAIDRLLHARGTIGTTVFQDRRTIVDSLPSPQLGTEFEQISAVIADAAVGSGDINRLKAWWLYRMLYTPNALLERLTLMWHNHFATSNVKVADPRLMFQQNETMRQFAGGRFGELLRRMATDPALLIWLDADANRKEHPNENLAREMMELFSLGVGNFSDNDVKEAARAITGWSVTRGKFRHLDEYHDNGEKTILGRKGHWTGDDFLSMLLDQPAIARRVAFRISEMFLGENLAPNDELRSELAEGLRERRLDVAWAIESVLRSETFFADKNIGNRVLGPAEFVIGAVRSLEIMAPPPSTLLLAETVAKLGQDLFAPPNVFGWPGGRSWLTSRTVIGRANFASALVSGQLHSPSKPFDAAQLARSYGFTSPDEVAAFFAQLLLGESHLPPELKPYIEQMKKMETLEKANELVTAILSAPEAQLA